MEGQNTDGVWKNAEKLVEFIWFSLCFHFARRGREGWRELTRQSFETTENTFRVLRVCSCFKIKPTVERYFFYEETRKIANYDVCFKTIFFLMFSVSDRINQ